MFVPRPTPPVQWFGRRSLAAAIVGLLFSPLLGATALAQPFGGRPPQPPATQPLSSLDQTRSQAEDAYKSGDYAKTISLADAALRQSPNDHVSLYLRGSARVESGVATGNADLLRSGIADSREAIRLGGGQNPIYYLPYLFGMTNLTAAEQRDDHAKVAVQIADQALTNASLKPDEKAKLTYQRGLANAALGKTDEAVRDYEAAIRLDPKLLAAYTAAADTLAQSGQFEKARAAFDRAVAAFPETPLVYNNRGMFFQQTGKYDESVADFTRAIGINGNYFYSYTNRGFTLLQKGEPQAAEADFTAALRINPNQPLVYGMRGNARLGAGRVAEALEDHRKAAEMAPSNPAVQTDLAFSLYFAGRYDDALRAFDRAFQLNPKFRHLDPWRVACLRELGRESEAQARFGGSLSQPPAQWDWVDHLLAFQLGKTDAERLRSVVSSEPTLQAPQRCEAEYFIGRRLAREGKTAEAQAAFRAALQTDATALSAYRGAKLAVKG